MFLCNPVAHALACFAKFQLVIKHTKLRIYIGTKVSLTFLFKGQIEKELGDSNESPWSFD